ncbi:MAG: ATP-binding cassette domain-containing protein [Nitrososphaeria archaeon]|nr:ATP-binding cassette domain-containing protein [Nitrososphaeria archaeon]NIN53545.1 ATP-binding cassette domain-containing protein [Nitrososphaeria archaeon]NIQ34064.1 ATP-binding cassette domain-containing protein [Nitrososphaeria archaeon]
MVLLTVRSATKRFGGVTAVDRCSMDLEEGEILGLIGPNGAGKTTLLNVINGVYKPEEGEVIFRGEKISGLKPHEVAKKGVGRTFQTVRIWRRMTILENMSVPIIHVPTLRREDVERSIELLKFVELIEFKDKLAMELSGGQQRLLEFAKSLVSNPGVVLMDEPLAGVHPILKKKLMDHILTLNKEGRTFIVVSHDIPSIMYLCKRILVMNVGKIIAEGIPEEIRKDERVIEAYLGV